MPTRSYVFKGTIKFIFDDGTEEATEAGEVFYWQSGNTAIVEEDLKLLDFSATKELNEVMDHMTNRMAESGE